MKKKRRQHHVWQRYLKSWVVNGRIHCLSVSDGHIFLSDTTNVAVERDFYKLHKLNSDDIGLIRMLVIDIHPIHPRTKMNHENFLKSLLVPIQFMERIRNISPNPEKLEEFLDIERTNVLENYHAGIEDSFVPLLDSILKNDINFYSSEGECITFLHFLCTQFFRTKGIKANVIERLQKNCGQDLTRIWDILSHMFATNIGMHLFLERRKRKLVLVQNNTEVTFITGDQPIINMYARTSQSKEKFSFYYPISPRLALILTESDEEPTFSTESLTPEQVSKLNARMLEACHSQVFGQSEASLLPSQELVLKLKQTKKTR
jgi:hypothetical protein